jgi:hypothetical protein
MPGAAERRGRVRVEDVFADQEDVLTKVMVADGRYYGRRS